MSGQRSLNDLPLMEPNADGNIWPKQSCPAFEARDGSPMGLNQCWYCRYADFHLYKPKALKVGICNWPRKIMK